jgi:hypothetical protein
LRKTVQQARNLALVALIGGFALALQAGAAPPGWIYSTYLGGTRQDRGRAIAVDATGTALVAGETLSSDFPTWPPGRPLGDGFLTRFTPEGRLGISIYFGLNSTDNYDSVSDLTRGPDGGAYVVGTSSYLYDSYYDRAFVIRIGSGLEQVYRFGYGDAHTRGDAVATDAAGNAYVTGSNFYEESHIPFQEAFVLKIDPKGQLLFHANLTGMSGQEGLAITVDAQGNAYVTGYTRSPDFPAVNAADGSLGGSQDAFVTKLDPSGAIVYSTFLGGNGREEGRKLALAPDGSLWVAGTTNSADFPTFEAGQTSLRGPEDLFLTRLSPTGTIVSSTYLGGDGKEELRGFDVDDSGLLYLAGKSESADFPPGGPREASCSGQFISQLSPAVQLLAVTCVPGADVQDLAVDPTGAVSLAGSTSGGLLVVNAFQPQPAGGGDAFTTRFRFSLPPDCTAAFASPATVWPPNGRLVPISIQGVTDPEGDPVAITVMAVRQDEPLQGTPTAVEIGTPGVSLRADRDSKGDGRVYRLSFTASDPSGGTCTGSVTVCVPHDQGRGRTCGDGGPLFDSTGR